MTDNFIGTIIEESLTRKDVLGMVKTVKTEVEKVTEEDRTPWLKKWTIHTVRITKRLAEAVAKELSESLEQKHAWYADFKNAESHYIVFREKIFKVRPKDTGQYDKVKAYGASLSIPDYQLDF